MYLRIFVYVKNRCVTKKIEMGEILILLKTKLIQIKHFQEAFHTLITKHFYLSIEEKSQLSSKVQKSNTCLSNSSISGYFLFVYSLFFCKSPYFEEALQVSGSVQVIFW